MRRRAHRAVLTCSPPDGRLVHAVQPQARADRLPVDPARLHCALVRASARAAPQGRRTRPDGLPVTIGRAHLPLERVPQHLRLHLSVVDVPAVWCVRAMLLLSIAPGRLPTGRVGRSSLPLTQQPPGAQRRCRRSFDRSSLTGLRTGSLDLRPACRSTGKTRGAGPVRRPRRLGFS